MKKNSSFSCTVKMLYSICTMCINNCSAYLTDFTDFKAFYTPQFITDSLQAIQDAKNLPSSRTAIAARKNARVNLAAAANKLRSNWQYLKVYITEAYPKDLAPGMLDDAGFQYFKMSASNQWSYVTALIDAATQFIANNLAALTDNQNMPVDFPLTFQKAANNFNDMATVFFAADNYKKLVVENKLNANNSIFESTMNMLKDGQQIFKDNDSVKAMFVFAQQVGIQEGTGSASLVGYIKNESKLPVAGATISAAEMGYGAVANAKGYYKISRMAEGTYNITISCPGYVPQTQQVAIVAGKKSKLNLTLASALKKQAAA